MRSPRMQDHRKKEKGFDKPRRLDNTALPRGYAGSGRSPKPISSFFPKPPEFKKTKQRDQTMTTSKNSAPGPVGTNATPSPNYVLIGGMKVGKSSLFDSLSASGMEEITLAGIMTAIPRGRLKNRPGTVLDTPGIYSLFSTNEDERASRDILLAPDIAPEASRIVLVADAKNLKRAIALVLQFAEYGLPMLLVVNMIDEAASRGIEIDYARLSEQLGIHVATTIAREGIGVRELARSLDEARPVSRRVTYSERIEQFLALLGKLMPSDGIESRALGLLLLTGDTAAERYTLDKFGPGMLSQVLQLVQDVRRDGPIAVDIELSNQYQAEAARIAEQVQKVEPPTKSSLLLSFGDWCTQFSTGVPIALGILAILYVFIGSFGATFLVDTIHDDLFEAWLFPGLAAIIDPIPSAFIQDMLLDPDFGIFPTGVFLALGLVMPVIFCFYIAFGFLQDSGYLVRLSILLDRLFRLIGLNGKGVIPLIMGFSCVTMSILTTRVLSTNKEKNIASFLVFLCLPCAPLLAVMMVILARMPISASITVYGLIFSQLLLAGWLAAKVIPGKRSQLILEIPVMRLPKPWPVIKMAARKTYFFIKEALPIFIIASLFVFLFQRVGGLSALEAALGPVINTVMGLPEQSVQVFIKTMIRRESGVAELEHLSTVFTNLQIVVNLVLMTFLAPCINATIVLFKERGARAGALILVTVTLYAILLGSLVNHICRLTGITFT
uniref:Magnetosome protein n=1 Tax=delta proteobacterium ML-1 TaxID=947513 RepID=K7Y0C1_9DELT|nr:magnetosome protein [delta proteobacterium ML-1]